MAINPFMAFADFVLAFPVLNRSSRVVDMNNLSVKNFAATVALSSPTYTMATLPPVGDGGGQIYVSDAPGGAVMAFSDGTNWRRGTDRTILS